MSKKELDRIKEEYGCSSVKNITYSETEDCWIVTYSSKNYLTDKFDLFSEVLQSFWSE